MTTKKTTKKCTCGKCPLHKIEVPKSQTPYWSVRFYNGEVTKKKENWDGEAFEWTLLNEGNFFLKEEDCDNKIVEIKSLFAG